MVLLSIGPPSVLVLVLATVVVLLVLVVVFALGSTGTVDGPWVDPLPTATWLRSIISVSFVKLDTVAAVAATTSSASSSGTVDSFTAEEAGVEASGNVLFAVVPVVSGTVGAVGGSAAGAAAETSLACCAITTVAKACRHIRSTYDFILRSAIVACNLALLYSTINLRTILYGPGNTDPGDC
uniref:Uncharacterized protein n=1 Tax=Anopheles darlingi TaxID=43151 RepID=A0A2M4DH45_ANODA